MGKPKKLINLTPHTVRVLFDNVDSVFIPCSGEVASRVAFDIEIVGHVEACGHSIETVRRKFGILHISDELWNDPENIFLVSSLFLEAARELKIEEMVGRIFCPDTGPTAMRSHNGNVVAVRRFVSL